MSKKLDAMDTISKRLKQTQSISRILMTASFDDLIPENEINGLFWLLSELLSDIEESYKVITSD